MEPAELAAFGCTRIDTRMQRDALEIAIKRAEEARQVAVDKEGEAAMAAAHERDETKRRKCYANQARYSIQAATISDMIAMLHGINHDLLKAEAQSAAAMRRAMGTS